eukprot:1464394-Pyramimonas_sp.AAC.1
MDMSISPHLTCSCNASSGARELTIFLTMAMAMAMTSMMLRVLMTTAITTSCARNFRTHGP